MDVWQDLIVALLQPTATLRPSASTVLRHSLIAGSIIPPPGVPQQAVSPREGTNPGAGSPVTLYRQAVQHEHAHLTGQCEAARYRTAANAAELKRLQSLRDFFENALQLAPGDRGML